MHQHTQKGRLLAVFGLVTLLGSACPNPNTYTTPRTAGSGKINHSLAPEAWGVTGTVSGTFPTLPTYTLRIGVGDRFEIGGRVANMSSLGADLKWNFLRSKGFDAAFDPAFQVFQIGVNDSSGTSSKITVSYLHVPLLLGLNLSRAVTLVATPGFVYAITSAEVTSTDSSDQAAASGALARMGFGADFRVNQGFAIHPEITFMRGLGSEATMLYIIGVGFNFGSLPNFDDVDGPPAGATPPGVPPGSPAP